MKIHKNVVTKKSKKQDKGYSERREGSKRREKHKVHRERERERHTHTEKEGEREIDRGAYSRLSNFNGETVQEPPPQNHKMECTHLRDLVPRFRRHPFLDLGLESVCVFVCVCVSA